MLFGSQCASTVHSVHESIVAAAHTPRFSLLPLRLERQGRVPGPSPHSITDNYHITVSGSPSYVGGTATRAVG